MRGCRLMSHLDHQPPTIWGRGNRLQMLFVCAQCEGQKQTCYKVQVRLTVCYKVQDGTSYFSHLWIDLLVWPLQTVQGYYGRRLSRMQSIGRTMNLIRWVLIYCLPILNRCATSFRHLGWSCRVTESASEIFNRNGFRGCSSRGR